MLAPRWGQNTATSTEDTAAAEHFTMSDREGELAAGRRPQPFVDVAASERGRGVHAGPRCPSSKGQRRGEYFPARHALGSGAGDRSGNSISSSILFGWVGVAAFPRRALLAVPTLQEVDDVRIITRVDELVEQLDQVR